MRIEALLLLWIGLTTAAVLAQNSGRIEQSVPAPQDDGAVYRVTAYPQQAADLAPGTGRDVVLAHCSTCHSVTYITMQPALPAANWEATVNKMIKTYGAAIPEPSARKIVAYLQNHYTPETRSATKAASPTNVYAQKCVACHMADGKGLPGVFPPLAGHFPELLRSPAGRAYVTHVVLFGVEGEIAVAGQNYDAKMPGWGPYLSDADLAEALNYVATSWDNSRSLPAGFKAITAEEIRQARTLSLSSAQVYRERPR